MHAKLQRATILTGVLTVLVLACFGTSKAAQFQDSDRFRDTEIFTVDVAVDVSTGAAILSSGGPNLGSTFIIDGKIFPGGALPKGAGMGDPNMRAASAPGFAKVFSPAVRVPRMWVTTRPRCLSSTGTAMRSGLRDSSPDSESRA